MSYLRRRPLAWAGAVALSLATLCLSAALFVGSPAAAADPVVGIEPDSATTSLGETVDVTVVIADVTDLYSASVHITFDPAVLQVVDADESRLGVQVFPGTFPGPSQGPGDVTMNVADNAAGTIDYDFTLLDPAPAVSGTGVLATIRFEGNAVGDSAVSVVSAGLWDAAEQPIAATTTDGSVEVAAAPTDTAVPTVNPTATGTRTSTPTDSATRTPQPTSTPRDTATPRPSATPNPPQSPVQPTAAAVAASAAQPTPSGGQLPSAGTGELPSQLWRWFFFSGAVVLGLATWAFTFRFYARQKEAERFWHR